MSEQKTLDSYLGTSLTVKDAIRHLETSANFLQQRLDTVQSQIDVHTFSLQTMHIHVRKSSRTSSLRKLLKLIELDEKQPMTMGSFLTKLNNYLLQNDYIDLNDLQIHTSPLIALVFNIPDNKRKIPYPFLLKELKELFD